MKSFFPILRWLGVEVASSVQGSEAWKVQAGRWRKSHVPWSARDEGAERRKEKPPGGLREVGGVAAGKVVGVWPPGVGLLEIGSEF